ENLEGRLVPTEFTREVLLDTTRYLSICALVLDEWNLARIDDYFGPVLSAIESGEPITLPGSLPGESRAMTMRAALPIDTLIIATCNSYLDEPDTRLPISGPVKRRSTIFEIPNLLYKDTEVFGIGAALERYGDLILQREKEEIIRRLGNKS